MGAPKTGEPRPEIIEIVKTSSSIKTRPGQVWYETPNYFRLWDSFGPVGQPIAKSKIQNILTK